MVTQPIHPLAWVEFRTSHPQQSIMSALIKTPHLNANEKYTAPTISTYETTLFHLSPSPNIT